MGTHLWCHFILPTSYSLWLIDLWTRTDMRNLTIICIFQLNQIFLFQNYSQNKEEKSENFTPNKKRRTHCAIIAGTYITMRRMFWLPGSDYTLSSTNALPGLVEHSFATIGLTL